MLRSLFKSGVALGLHATHADRAFAKVRGSHRIPFIVGYHRTVEKFSTDPKRTIPAMCISVKMLEQQLDWIGRRFRIVSLDELKDERNVVKTAGKRVAAVTFDDGYQDFYELAFPLLKRKGIPAAVFIVTDLVGTSRLLIHDILYLLLSRLPERRERDPHTELESLLHSLPQEQVRKAIDTLRPRGQIEPDILKEHRLMNWDEIARVHAAGITVGSHTQTHVVLPNEKRPRIAKELIESKQTLESRLRTKIEHFAYPCGRFDTPTVHAVEQAGYRFAYTVCQHRDRYSPRLTMPRKLLWEKSCLDVLGTFSPAIMSCQVHGSFDLFAPCKMNHTARA